MAVIMLHEQNVSTVGLRAIHLRSRVDEDQFCAPQFRNGNVLEFVPVYDISFSLGSVSTLFR